MTSSPELPVEEGVVITVSCTSGYSITGDNHVTCQADQSFQFNVQPNCKGEAVKFILITHPLTYQSFNFMSLLLIHQL